ncbi:mitochondrial genome maintenance [Cordyceps militaris]|uniref:Mitochondrial genome maintenance protein MGM101 n=1 Tax=Cordyceps militaris TaxID=73501 RepID=A0A2H4S611_CORMI|nr:mitochondrial genome maintenance [Cordyceps militaris]
MNASRTALSQGQRQLRSSSRFATRSLTALSTRFWSTSSAAPDASSKTIPPAPKVSTLPDTAKPTPTKAAPSKPAAPKPFSKPYSTATSSSSKAATASSAIPSDLFYQPTTVAHAEETVGGDDAVIPAVDWSASFHGIASRPVSQRQFAALLRPLDIDDIEVKPDGIVYLPEIRYRRRLNEAFGPMGWGLVPKGEAVVGDSVVTREYALIVDGRFVSQAQGENSYFGADQLPSAVEGCKSNALMRCCKDLGIASELWDPSFVRWFKKNRMEEVWVEHATTKKKRTLWYRKGAVDVAYPWRQAK